VLAKIPTLVGPRAMQEAMGATKTELAALWEEGLLTPHTQIAKVKNPWQISDGLALVADLSARATSVAEDDQDWETLLLAIRLWRINAPVPSQPVRKPLTHVVHLLVDFFDRRRNKPHLLSPCDPTSLCMGAIADRGSLRLIAERLPYQHISLLGGSQQTSGRLGHL
jgi:hypothetical protein